MSSSSTSEKDLRSLDEDSGHDSIDDAYSSPAEDRERIEHLETVVTWIRQEVKNLKDYDRDILEELWKIRSSIQDIQRVHKQSQEAESKYLDDSIPDRSPTPDEALLEAQEANKQRQSYIVLTKEGSPKQSRSPAQSHTPTDQATPPPSKPPNKCNTLDLMRTAPSHLMPSDDELLEQFFGSDQVEKLNKFKQSLEEEKTQKEEQEREYEDFLRKNAGNKLQIPVNPNRSSSRYSCDVASEMEQLRARLHETAFKQLEEFDKKFSPKLTRPGINPASGESSHSRQGSLDSSLPPQPLLASPLIAPSHRRDFSLPVYMDPSTSGGSPQSGSGNSSPFATRSATQLLRNQAGEPVTISEGDIRSPTPPLQYGHIRQLSGGSNSSSSGTFSPPPVNTVTSPSGHHVGSGLSYNMPRYGGSGGALNRPHLNDQSPKLSPKPTGSGLRGSSPSLFEQGSRSPNTNFQGAKTNQSSGGVQRSGGGTNSSLPRTSGGGGSGLVTFGTNLSLTRNSGGVVMPRPPPTNTSTNNNSSLNRIRNAVPINAQQVLPNPPSGGSVPLRRSVEGSNQPHYSTAVIKKRRSGDGGSRRSSGEVAGYQFDDNQSRRNSGPQSPVGLKGSLSDVNVQLEQKSIPISAQQQRLMAPHERIPGSPKMTRKPPLTSGTASSSSYGQQSLTRKSDSNISEANAHSANSDLIQPYASTADAKARMKYYKYAPYAADSSGRSAAEQNALSRGNQQAQESSWC